MQTGLTITNYADLVNMLNGLLPSLRTRVVQAGLNEAGSIIISEAKQRLNRTKKGKSKTNYSYYSRVFRAENLKARNDTELGGVKVGISKEGWKLRFNQWGTRQRKYMITASVKSAQWKQERRGTYHRTGKMVGSDFFYGAVKARQKEAYEIIGSAILESLEKNVKKYNKTV